MQSFILNIPRENRVPILLSSPHSGTAFPEEIKEDYKKNLIIRPDDTDWFVDKLYDFAPSMGITTINAVYSRWVIDLNRDPQSKPLYNDGRIITALCPSTDFFGNAIYKDERSEVKVEEVHRRVKEYYQPYHNKLMELVTELKEEFGKVLLWDCHSIRQLVPTIRAEKFPDLILGDADGTSASPGLIEGALRGLEESEYTVSHNHPFKGGYITRNYGKPSVNQHALQLEMTKVKYMNDEELEYHPQRAEAVRNMLKRTFERLITVLG